MCGSASICLTHHPKRHYRGWRPDSAEGGRFLLGYFVQILGRLRALWGYQVPDPGVSGSIRTWGRRAFVTRTSLATATIFLTFEAPRTGPPCRLDSGD